MKTMMPMIMMATAPPPAAPPIMAPLLEVLSPPGVDDAEGVAEEVADGA
jgi:hypothetical protein